MPEKSTPKYRRQRSKTSDRAFVELSGVRHYLGVYDSAESRTEYHRLLAEWAANGKHLSVKKEDLLIKELTLRFWEHAQKYYVRPDGEQTSEVSNFKQVLKVLNELYSERLVREFGPLALKAVREKMIEKEWVRGNINKQISRLKMVFRWGVAEEIVEAPLYQALLAVPGLKRGRCTAVEADPVLPVPETHVEAIKPYVSRQVWAIIQLQLLSAARSGELVVMRTKDLRTGGHVWTYTPELHKTSHHGHTRTIYFGPRAQEVLAPFLVDRATESFLFSAVEAIEEHREKMHAKRVTPLSCGNRPGTNISDNPICQPGERYTQESYRRSIARGCKKAGIPPWHPHQLRHNAATRLRAEFGIEVAQVMLGHARADVTQIYAQVNHAKALDVAVKAG